MSIPPDLKIGSLHETNNSGFVEVIDYKNSKDITIMFTKTGNVKKVRSDLLRLGKIKDRDAPPQQKRTVAPRDLLVGSIHQSSECGEYIIVDYENSQKITVEFITTGTRRTRRADSVRQGKIRDPFAKTVLEVGFIGVDRERISSEPAYRPWLRMLERCYGKQEGRNKTYKGVTVCDEWHCYDTFSKWYSENFIPGYQLDKDIKVKGNRVYGPDTCQFVSREENMGVLGSMTTAILDDGEKEYIVTNVCQFCRDNNINQSKLSDVIWGKRKSHLGFQLVSIISGKALENGAIITNGNINKCVSNVTLTAKWLDLDAGALSRVLSGERKTHKGWSLKA